jgi:hypothetical protein
MLWLVACCLLPLTPCASPARLSSPSGVWCVPTVCPSLTSSGKFGQSAAVGLVSLPKPQQAILPKQTWAYSQASGALLLPLRCRCCHHKDRRSVCCVFWGYAFRLYKHSA